MSKILENFFFDVRRIVSLEAFTSKRLGMSDLLLPVCFVDDGTLLNKDGSFTKLYRYSGADIDSLTDEDLDYLNSKIYSNAFSLLGDGWTMHLDCDRCEVFGYIPREQNYFPDATSYMIDEERRLDYEREGVHYINRFIITFTYLPPSDKSSRGKQYFMEDGEGLPFTHPLEHLNKFHQTLSDLFSILDYQVYTQPLSNEETLSYLNKRINGFSYKFQSHKHSWLDLYYRLGNQDLIKGVVPKIGQYKIGVVSVGEGLPGDGIPALLHELTTLEFEYCWSTRFIFLDKESAKKLIDFTAEYHYQDRESIKQNLSNKHRASGTQRFNRSAETFAEQAEGALESIEVENVTYGKYTCSVIVFDKNAASLEVKIDQVTRLLMKYGFLAKREEINATDCYLGTIPGMVRNNTRKWLMDTINLADIMPTTDVWSGYEKNPCQYFEGNNPQLFYASTEGNTPFYGCLHVGDIGNAFLVGPSRMGKSVLLNFLAAQNFRYKGMGIYHFDNGYSGLPLCHAMNGTHFDIASNESQLYFKPLNLLDNESDFSFCVDWLSEIAELNLNRKINSLERADITKILEIIQKQGKAEHKTINYFYLQLKSHAKNNELANAFIEYTNLHGNGSTLKSKLFNAIEDKLSLSRFSMFEVEQLIKTGENVFIPTMRYIFHMIYRTLDGSPKVIIIEEFAAIIKHPIMQTAIETWLRRLAKKNVSITIGNARPQREYYLSNAVGNKLFNLNLNTVAITFLGKTSMEDILLAKKLKAQHKDLFGYYWLKHFGQDNAATIG